MAKKKPAMEKLPPQEVPITLSGANSEVSSTYPATVIGVGASAGGLEAFSELLHALPDEPKLAIVFVQHLSPDHPSSLEQLLGHQTRLKVIQVQGATPIQQNCVYVIPPDASLSVNSGVLQLQPRPHNQPGFSPIDVFFRSLAADAQERAIAVVLSGMGTDGTEGVRHVKTAGGIVFVQSPESAKFDSMPRAVIDTGLVDSILSPAEIAQEVARLAQHKYLKSSHVVDGDGQEFSPTDDQLRRIFELLKVNSGVDFSYYKPPTIRRRLQRRMALQKISSAADYLMLLERTSAEVTALYQDILIHVTRFFREPSSFDTLKEQVFPKLLEQRSADDPVRIWVPGCSTGAEPYSIGMALLEYLDEQKAQSIAVQIFATDVSELAVEHARTGFYPKSISEDVSPERLRRFFIKSDGGYRINKTIRDLCVFARQDLTRDPPFSKLDLIVCRNVMIYLGTTLQKRLLNVFHYALKSSGFLMLGAAETASSQPDLFLLAEKKHRIYRKRLLDGNVSFNFPVDFTRGRHERSRHRPAEVASTDSYRAEANRILLDRYSPPGVIVDSELQILQFRGQTGPYLEPAPGDASLNLLKMARDGLLHGLRTSIHAAGKSGQAERKEGLRVKHNDGYRNVAIEVIPLAGGGGGYFLVLFESPAEVRQVEQPPSPPLAPDARSQQLEQELASTQEYLHSIIQDLEATNEELQSANEEILSSNEELQSTNEELDTAKEELQSTNEELNTLNEELHGRNEELSRANSDLVNLLGSMQIAIVIVTADLRIRRYTPVAERILNLIHSDLGRPIGHIKPNIDCPDLEHLIAEAVDQVTSKQRDVQDSHGRWYSLMIRPYKNLDNRIDGAVLTLADVHDLRTHQAQIQQAQRLAQAIVTTIREPMVVLDGDLRVKMVNRAFAELFGVDEVPAEGQRLLEVAGGIWDVPGLRRLLLDVLPNNEHFENYPLEAEFAKIGRKVLLLNARRMEAVSPDASYILLAMQDVTDRSSP